MKKLTEPIVFITGNLHKVQWTQRYIHVPITHKKLDLVEIQSLDPKEVVEHKVRQAYELLHEPVLVEDTSLIFHALGKLPGPFIKWFIEELGNDKLCELITVDRSATAIVTFGYFDGHTVKFGQALVKGMITNKPLGTNGFGWDPIFIPDGENKTHAEMSDEEIDKISVRRLALEELKKIL